MFHRKWKGREWKQARVTRGECCPGRLAERKLHRCSTKEKEKRKGKRLSGKKQKSAPKWTTNRQTAKNWTTAHKHTIKTSLVVEAVPSQFVGWQAGRQAAQLSADKELAFTTEAKEMHYIQNSVLMGAQWLGLSRNTMGAKWSQWAFHFHPTTSDPFPARTKVVRHALPPRLKLKKSAQ